MVHLPLSRLTVIGLIFLLPGLYFGARFGSGFIRVLSRKFRRGRPYLRGSATDYFAYAAASLALALLGAVLTLASAIQGGFQPLSGPRLVGRVTAEAPQEGRLRLRVILEEGHPGRRDLDIVLSGSRWALGGEFLRWKAGPRWVGFRDGHRIESALATRAASGPPDRSPDSQALVAGTYPLWYLAHRHPRWAPLVEASRRQTPWMPADGRSFRIFASPVGYILVEETKGGSAEGGTTSPS